MSDNKKVPPNPKKIPDPKANPRGDLTWSKIKEPPRDARNNGPRGDKRVE